MSVSNRHLYHFKVNCRQKFIISNLILNSYTFQLFDHIAECMAKFLALNKLGRNAGRLPLGFTFSFPCKQDGLTSAVLIKWTKGFCASGVENNDVVKLLREACQRRKVLFSSIMHGPCVHFNERRRSRPGFESMSTVRRQRLCL